MGRGGVVEVEFALGGFLLERYVPAPVQGSPPQATKQRPYPWKVGQSSITPQSFGSAICRAASSVSQSNAARPMP